MDTNLVTIENSYLPIATTFIRSKNVKIFPCAYRGYYSAANGSKVFDPEARGFTEYNYSNIYSKPSISKESFVISWETFGKLDTDNYHTLLKCVIGGYYFEIKDLFPEDFWDSERNKRKVLALRVEEITLATSDETADGTRTSKVIDSLCGTDFYLDVERNNIYIFAGLTVIEEEAASTSTSFSYWLAPFKNTASTGKPAVIEFNWEAQRIGEVLDIGPGRYSLQSFGETNAAGTESDTSLASGDYSLALGRATTASGDSATALGQNTIASGKRSFALGDRAVADGENSIAVGVGTLTRSANQIAMGAWNKPGTSYLLMLGNGSSSARRNVWAVCTDGTIESEGGLYIEGAATFKNTVSIEKKLSINDGIEANGSLTAKGSITVNKASTINTLYLGNELKGCSGAIYVYSNKANAYVFKATENGSFIKDGLEVSGGIKAAKVGESKLQLGSNVTGYCGSLDIYGESTTKVFEVTKGGAVYGAGRLRAESLYADTWVIASSGINSYGQLTVYDGGASITGSTSISGRLTVSTGGAAITGDSTITGKLRTTDEISIGTASNKVAIITSTGSISGTGSFTLKSSAGTSIFDVASSGEVNTIGKVTATGFKIGSNVTMSYLSSDKLLDITKGIRLGGGLLLSGAIKVYELTSAGKQTDDWSVASVAKTEKASIDTSGNVSVAGTVSAGGKLTIKAGGADITGATKISSTAEIGGKLTVKTGGAEITGAMTTSSTIAAGGEVSAPSFAISSDIRRKTNIKSYKCEKSILDLDVKEFEYINDDTHTKHIGCIAQELQQICPELVHIDPEGYLTVAETKLVYLLLQEVKTLKQEIKELKGE